MTALQPSLTTVRTVAADLRGLGLGAGDTVLVHASFRTLGFVCGGPFAVVSALLTVLGPRGTLVVPTHTADNSDPAGWRGGTRPVLDRVLWEQVRRDMPPFDPAATPSRGMGVLAECVRTWPGARRSTHPQTSFAAVGRRARAVVRGHAVDCHLGERSPLARLAELDAKVLLLGVGFDVCTCFHLAEYRLPDPPTRGYACAVPTRRGSDWFEYEDVVLDDGDFGDLGADFAGTGQVVRGRVGAAECRLFGLPAAVDFAVDWLPRHRTADGP